MNKIKDFSDRNIYATMFVIVMILILLCRLLYIQVIDKSYQGYSKNNTVRSIVRYPSRGDIFDRNGELIAKSNEAYDLMAVPRDMKEFDTLHLATILDVTVDYLREQIIKARKYSSRRESIIIAQLNQKKMLMIEEMNIPGISFSSHPIRTFTSKSAGSIFGYMGQVSASDIRNDDYYIGGDFIAKSGFEKTYEHYLRGEKGVSYKMVDVHGVVRGEYENGADDIAPINGKEITSTIDIKLQELGARLLKGKIGSIVAIEPSTGEVLAMVTSPTYDPDSLAGMDMAKTYQKLSSDPRQPLFNRATQGNYAPGSTFKLANALLIMQDSVSWLSERIDCHGEWSVTGRTLKCRHHDTPLNMEYAIQVSCNTYFSIMFRRLLKNKKYGGRDNAMDAWANSIRSMGLGVDYETDISAMRHGSIPDSKLYNRMYNRYWNDVTVISLGIGQGEISISPLQIANFVALIANEGYYYPPHLLKSIEGVELADVNTFGKERVYCDVDPVHFAPIKKAMWKGVNATGTMTEDTKKILDLNICGKSGTSQNSRGEDHSTFAAFAPMNDPKIAIAVYVEHGGWGSSYGKPIATLMIEQYLRGEVKRTELLEYIENRVIDYPIYDKKEEAK